MKKTNYITSKLGMVALFAIAFALLFMVPAAQADSLTIPSAISAGVSNATVTTTGTAYTITRNTDLGLALTSAAGASGTSNNVYGFNYQVAGVWTTTTPLLITNANNGTNPVTSFTVVSKANLPGVNAIRLDYFSTTQTNPVTPSFVGVDWIH